MQRGYFKGRILQQSKVERELPKETAVALRRRHKSRRLTLPEIIDVVHRVVVKQEYQTDLSKEYYVLPTTICQLMKKVKKSPAVLHSLLAEHEGKYQLCTANK